MANQGPRIFDSSMHGHGTFHPEICQSSRKLTGGVKWPCSPETKTIPRNYHERGSVQTRGTEIDEPMT